MTTDTEYLQARYGAHRSDRQLAWIIGGILAAVALGWFVWQAIALNQPTLYAEEQALNPISDSQIEVTFNVHAELGSTVACTVRAYTENTTEVGVKEVTIGPLEQEWTTVTESVATIQAATGARVTDCRFIAE